MNPVTDILHAERAYPGGDVLDHLPSAHTHADLVATWLAVHGPAQAAEVRFVDAVQLREVVSALLIHDGAGAVLVPEQRVLIDAGYPLFTRAGLLRFGSRLMPAPHNPLEALRWTLTDLMLRAGAVNAPISLTVADYAGDVVPVPYARGFAIGSGAIYARSYHFGQPTVNLGFDDVALKVLAGMLSQAAGLSYVANVTLMAPFAAYIKPVRELLGASGIAAGTWQSLYQQSRVEDAIFALIARSRKHFGQDPDSSHLGPNVARSGYGYGIMKAVSLHDTRAFQRALIDFALPAEHPIPTVIVS